MRRHDREVTDPERIRAVIDSCGCMRIGFIDGDEVYIVPLDFGYIENGGKYTFYFHGAKEGRKAELLKSSPKVGFEADAKHEVVGNYEGCMCTALYESVIGTGTARIVEDDGEKRLGLDAIMEHAAGRVGCEYNAHAFERVCVFKVECTQLTCKIHE